MDEKANRYFRVCVEEALAALPDQIRLLQQKQGAKDVLAKIKEARKARDAHDDIAAEQAPSKRLKGPSADYARELAAHLKKSGEKPVKKPTAAKPKKATEVEKDPWNLGSSEVRSDWKQMKAAPLAIFSCVVLLRTSLTDCR